MEKYQYNTIYRETGGLYFLREFIYNELVTYGLIGEETIEKYSENLNELSEKGHDTVGLKDYLLRIGKALEKYKSDTPDSRGSYYDSKSVYPLYESGVPMLIIHKLRNVSKQSVHSSIERRYATKDEYKAESAKLRDTHIKMAKLVAYMAVLSEAELQYDTEGEIIQYVTGEEWKDDYHTMLHVDLPPKIVAYYNIADEYGSTKVRKRGVIIAKQMEAEKEQITKLIEKGYSHTKISKQLGIPLQKVGLRLLDKYDRVEVLHLNGCMTRDALAQCKKHKRSITTYPFKQVSKNGEIRNSKLYPHKVKIGEMEKVYNDYLLGLSVNDLISKYGISIVTVHRYIRRLGGKITMLESANQYRLQEEGKEVMEEISKVIEDLPWDKLNRRVYNIVLGKYNNDIDKLTEEVSKKYT